MINIRKDEIIKAPIEEVANMWGELYNEAQILSMYIDAYYNEPCGDIFDTRDIKDFNKLIKKAEKEMRLIEQLRPEIIEYLFGGIEEWKQN